MSTVRVAAVQMGIGSNPEENLAHCLEKIDEASKTGARIVVLPELCNHSSFYASQTEAYELAVEPDGPFLKAIADSARSHDCFVVLTVTVRQQRPEVRNRQLLYSPQGDLVVYHDKEVQFGQENDHITRGDRPSEVVRTEFGLTALYSCMDGVIPETSRVPSLRGAQILFNPLNSCGRDEGELHIPVRAAENRVWVVAANKAWYDVPEVGRVWSGRSEIVDPHGHSVVQANADGKEEIVWADIDIDLANDKKEAGGGDVMQDRRPEAYGVLRLPLEDLPFYKEGRDKILDPLPARLAVVQATEYGDIRRLALESKANVVALPERINATLEQVRDLAKEANAYIGTSLLDGGKHIGVLVDPSGDVRLRYRPVHLRPSEGGPDEAGSRFEVIDTPFGRLGLMVGYDGAFLESARVLALMGAETILYPTSWHEEWEVNLGMPARAAENHINILAASRPDSPLARGSLLIPIVKRTVVRGPNILLNRYQAFEAPAGLVHLLTADVDINATHDKQIFRNTNIMAQRRAELYDSLVESRAPQAV